MRRLIFVLIAVFLAATFCSGCGKKEDKKPPQQMSKSESAAAQKHQEQMPKKTADQYKPGIKSISDNPGFYGVSDTTPVSDEVKDLDSAIRPVLKQLFGDAKMVAESKSAETKIDGEVVENSFTYVVKQILVPEDGKALHAALHAAQFGLSPRLGAQPTIWKGGAMMSLFRTTSRRSYSLVINVNTNKQQIVVESYKLGSRYDRLM